MIAKSRRPLHLTLVSMALAWSFAGPLLFPHSGFAQSSQQDDSFRIRVTFPLTGPKEERLRRQLTEIANRPSSGERPLVVLEFQSDSKNEDANSERRKDGLDIIGKGTTFDRALGLSRWLISAEGNRVRSVAYLPSSIQGHAVLVALACEEISMAPNASIGRAFLDEPSVDATIKQAYRDVRERRQLFPQSSMDALLDPVAQIYKVELREGGTKFVLAAELQELQRSGNILNENQIGLPGQATLFFGQQMREWGWVSHLIRDPAELAGVLQVRGALTDPQQNEGPWRPAVFEVRGNVTQRSVNQLLRAIEFATQNQNANFLLLEIDSPGGALEESLRLAQQIASYDSQSIRTVAYLSGQARGDAALIALACDTLYASDQSTLGGAGESTILPEDVQRLSKTLQLLATQSERSIGEFEGPICPKLDVFLYSNDNGGRKWASEGSIQQDQTANWVRGEKLNVGEGLNAKRLTDLRWIRSLRESKEAVANDFGIEKLPEAKRSNPVEMFVQRLADQSWLPPLLITIGFMALMMELSTPGMTVPGFVAALCFLLFFWIRFLNGTVEWLEVLLFVGGAVAVAIELFVLPGFGIFGFGGLIMLFTAMILASQTFLWPSNSYQLNEMAWNMGQVAGAILGIGIGLFLIRNHLENLPVFRWLKLQPVGFEEAEALSEREKVAHFDHLAGKLGVAMTHCVPSGKAQIGDDLVNVLSEGPMIEEGQNVRVVEVRGNTIVVVPIV